MTDMVPATAADVRDQHWLDQQVAVLGDGIEAAKEIWLNWSDLRCVGRLHPGMTAGDFLASVLGGLRLDVGELVKALPDMSTREIAKVAGVSKSTVANERGVQNWTPDAEPARVVGADGKSYPGHSSLCPAVSRALVRGDRRTPPCGALRGRRLAAPLPLS